MILTKKVLVKEGSRNKNYFLNKGYVLDNGYFFVNVDDLLPTSRIQIECKCDFCEKKKITNYKNYYFNYNYNGYNLFSCSSKCSHKKSILTCNNKYGTDYCNQSVIIKNKTFENSIVNINYYDKKLLLNCQLYRKYIISDEVIVTINKFNINHYKNLGYYNIKCNQKWFVPVEHLMINSSVKINCKCIFCDSIKNISMQKFTENYNRHNFYSCKSCSNKSYELTFIKKYGVINTSQITEFFSKSQKTGLKVKDFKSISYQGTYELDFLKYMDNLSILNDVSKLSTIKYFFNGKNRVYYPDFYLKKYNLIVEIKSSYYYNISLDKNLAKQKSCIEQGYNYLFILNKDYSELFLLIKKHSN